MDNTEVSKMFNTHYSGSDESLENAILMLKNAGYSQMSTLKCLIDQLKISIPEGDLIILNSKAWSKEKSDNLKFRDQLGDILESGSEG